MDSLGIIKFVTMGALFGLTAGISPGPLLTLVITETLKHNKKEGIKIALAPLITDLPIILLTLIIFSKLLQFHSILSVISSLGGIFIAYLGYTTIRTNGINTEIKNNSQASLKKGIVANILNPHPYLFWLTVGVPVALKAYHKNIWACLLFFISFYVLLIGSKVCITLLVDRSKTFLNNRAYIWIMRALGIILLIFSILFIYDGIKLLDR